MIYNWKPYFTLKDSVMDPSYDGPDMWCAGWGAHRRARRQYKGRAARTRHVPVDA